MGKSREKKQAASSSIQLLAKAIHKATRSAKFVVDGALPVADPGLVVEGLGRVPVPLKRGAAKALIALSSIAPYGKGTKTLIDEQVRKTFELDASKFTLGDEWNTAIADATRTVAQALGLPEHRLEARLYKLLIYEKGGFFLPHRDSEKHDRMVASLIAVLPNPFEGGKLIVRHGSAEQEIPFQVAGAGTRAHFAAFYADCEHQVERVTHGIRLALAYNLVLAPGRAVRSAKPSTPADGLAEAIGTWVARHPAEPLVFALDHHYTQRGLSLDLLKGADRKLAEEVVAAAERSGCFVHLAQVSRHLTNSAFDEYDRYGYGDFRLALQSGHRVLVGEEIEDELYGEEWADLDGKKQPWRAIRFDPSAIISTIPLDDWKPTSEEYEGYTGNAGNMLDRWYHRSAVVVWLRDHHYGVVTRGNAADCIPQFCSMVKKLPKTPKAKRDETRDECLRFARALVANWPSRYSHMQWGDAAEAQFEAFSESLLLLHDRDLIAAFLLVLAERDNTTSLKSFVVAACREFGWDAFERELKMLISPRLDQYGRQKEFAARDLEWLAEFCGEKTHDPDWRILAGQLCKIAVERFCQHEDRRWWAREREKANASETSLPLLLRALAASGRDDDFARVIRFIREEPNEFTLDYGQVPALKSLIPWSRDRLGSIYMPLQSWFETVQNELEQATATKPTPPPDWSRPANIDCKCKFCAQLNAFLADPKAEIGRIPAADDKRRHVIQQIERHRSDVRHGLERTGRPYSLVLTKTTGSYDRAMKRYEKDRHLLRELRSLT